MRRSTASSLRRLIFQRSPADTPATDTPQPSAGPHSPARKTSFASTTHELRRTRPASARASRPRQPQHSSTTSAAASGEHPSLSRSARSSLQAHDPSRRAPHRHETQWDKARARSHPSRPPLPSKPNQMPPTRAAVPTPSPQATWSKHSAGRADHEVDGSIRCVFPLPSLTRDR